MGSEELSEACDGEPKVSREFRADLRMGVRELREEPWLLVGDREGGRRELSKSGEGREGVERKGLSPNCPNTPTMAI